MRFRRATVLSAWTTVFFRGTTAPIEPVQPTRRANVLTPPDLPEDMPALGLTLRAGSERRPEEKARLRDKHQFFRFAPLRESEYSPSNGIGQKAWGGLARRLASGEGGLGFAWPGRDLGSGGIRHVLNKTPSICVYSGMGKGGNGRMSLASAAKCLKRLKIAMSNSWKKLAWIWVWRHVGLGLAPRPFGARAASSWDRRNHATQP
jgi:hypothetical protein